MSAVAHVASSRVTGTMNPYANLTDAGVAAANVAAALGKARRDRPITDTDKRRLGRVAETLNNYEQVISGGRYFSLVANSKSRNALALDTMIEVAIRSNGGSQDTSSLFTSFASGLTALSSGHTEEVSSEDLDALHEYFRNLTKTIQRMLTSPGETIANRSFR